MWKTGAFGALTAASVDSASGDSAPASFSAGHSVGRDKLPCSTQNVKYPEPCFRVRDCARPRHKNPVVPLLQRGESTIGPVAINGRTITLVARTRALHIGGDERGALHIRARPAHVEVLDEHGRRLVVRIRDVETALVTAIAAGGLVGACVVRAIRRRRPR